MYTIIIEENTLDFQIIKNGKELPFNDCLNLEWAMQNVLAVIKRTESEKKRRDSDDYNPKAETTATKNKRARENLARS